MHLKLQFFKVYCHCVCVCITVCVFECHRKVSGNWSSNSTTRGLGTELKSYSMGVRTFTYRAISTAQNQSFIEEKPQVNLKDAMFSLNICTIINCIYMRTLPLK